MPSPLDFAFVAALLAECALPRALIPIAASAAPDAALMAPPDEVDQPLADFVVQAAQALGRPWLLDKERAAYLDSVAGAGFIALLCGHNGLTRAGRSCLVFSFLVFSFLVFRSLLVRGSRAMDFKGRILAVSATCSSRLLDGIRAIDLGGIDHHRTVVQPV